jgi:hypothetical protein
MAEWLCGNYVRQATGIIMPTGTTTASAQMR